MGRRDIMRFAELAAARRYRALWLHCVKPGTFDLTEQFPFIPGLTWPTDLRLSVCCADTATGARVVYERESGANLADVVAASCAVLGVIQPVEIGERVLVDGGVVSPTNADLALEEREDSQASVTVILSDERHGRTLCSRASLVDVCGEPSAQRVASK
ncbi:MAG: patatin-like phospholipase family protein [Ilumatobacteraceae bacterium]